MKKKFFCPGFHRHCWFVGLPVKAGHHLYSSVPYLEIYFLLCIWNVYLLFIILAHIIARLLPNEQWGSRDRVPTHRWQWSPFSFSISGKLKLELGTSLRASILKFWLVLLRNCMAQIRIIHCSHSYFVLCSSTLVKAEKGKRFWSTGNKQSFCLHIVCSAYFLQMIICSPKMFLPPPSPVERRSFLNRNILLSVHTLVVIFNFCFYCREHEQNVSFAL